VSSLIIALPFNSAVMQEVNHYIWGDPLPDFTAPELPKKERRPERSSRNEDAQE